MNSLQILIDDQGLPHIPDQYLRGLGYSRGEFICMVAYNLPMISPCDPIQDIYEVMDEMLEDLYVYDHESAPLAEIPEWIIGLDEAMYEMWEGLMKYLSPIILDFNIKNYVLDYIELHYDALPRTHLVKLNFYPLQQERLCDQTSVPTHENHSPYQTSSGAL